MSNIFQYGEKYFAFQREMGHFGGWAELFKFSPYIRTGDAVLDFGCGGGYLLHNLTNVIKAGLEINTEARKVCSGLGLTVYSKINEVPDEHFDIIISNHALEHCVHPLAELIQLKEKLKPEGRAIFFVPSETSRVGYNPRDPNYHLYTWSPMNLGNLFVAAGFEVVSAGPYNHRWPPGYETIARFLGRRGFEFCCRLYGLYCRNIVTQTYCLAKIKSVE